MIEDREMLTLNRTVELIAKIEERGLRSEMRKHVAYFYKLKRKGIITEGEYLKAYEATVESLGAAR